MNSTTARCLIGYGVFLLAMGITGFLSNPEKAKTALISGGTFGSISILWGVLGLKGLRWSWLAALLTTAFLALVFTWRSAVSWKAVADGSTDKRFAAILIATMLVGSLVMLGLLIKSRRFRQPNTAEALRR
jgi:hypothetical protein